MKALIVSVIAQALLFMNIKYAVPASNKAPTANMLFNRLILKLSGEGSVKNLPTIVSTTPTEKEYTANLKSLKINTNTDAINIIYPTTKSGNPILFLSISS